MIEMILTTLMSEVDAYRTIEEQGLLFFMSMFSILGTALTVYACYVIRDDCSDKADAVFAALISLALFMLSALTFFDYMHLQNAPYIYLLKDILSK